MIGENGKDINPDNNADQDVDDVFLYVYDGFDGRDDTVDGIYLGDRPLQEINRIVTLDPMYSGRGEANSTQEVLIYDQGGNVIARESVVVDTGGNWMVSFPGAMIYDAPHHIEIQSTYSTTTADGFGHYNLRTYFSPAIYGNMYAGVKQNMGEILVSLSPERIESLSNSQSQSLVQVEENDGYGYDFLAVGYVPSSN